MANFTPLSEVCISPNRQRQEFDPEAITDLANSIAAIGLMHPPVMRETPEGLILVAGERRLRALSDLHAIGTEVRYHGVPIAPGMIPYATLGELNPLAAEEAELDENLKRKDLTWQEQSAALARLHSLRQKQSPTGTQSFAATAAEIKENVAGTREKILLAFHLDNPEVAKAKTAKDAFKIVKRQEETLKNKELAERVGATFGSSSHQLVHSNCFRWLETQSENQFDCILTDPPYGMGADRFGDAGGKLGNSEHHYQDSYEEWQELARKLPGELYRVTKPQAHVYIFCDFDRFHELKVYMEQAGWYVFRTPLIAYKTDSGRVPLPEHGPRRQYECCLFANKGKKPVTAIYSDVIPCRLEENLGHGANKPIELFQNLLVRSCRPGDSVLDCFAGTGTIFPAAQALKLRATGIELSPEYYAIAYQRLEALDSSPTLV